MSEFNKNPKGIKVIATLCILLGGVRIFYLLDSLAKVATDQNFFDAIWTLGSGVALLVGGTYLMALKRWAKTLLVYLIATDLIVFFCQYYRDFDQTLELVNNYSQTPHFRIAVLPIVLGSLIFRSATHYAFIYYLGRDSMDKYFS